MLPELGVLWQANFRQRSCRSLVRWLHLMAANAPENRKASQLWVITAVILAVEHLNSKGECKFSAVMSRYVAMLGPGRVYILYTYCLICESHYHRIPEDTCLQTKQRRNTED